MTLKFLRVWRILPLPRGRAGGGLGATDFARVHGVEPGGWLFISRDPTLHYAPSGRATVMSCGAVVENVRRPDAQQVLHADKCDECKKIMVLPVTRDAQGE